MSDEAKGGISDKARQAANVAAINAIECAQRLNGLYPGPIDPARVVRLLDEVAGRVAEAKRELAGEAWLEPSLRRKP